MSASDPPRNAGEVGEWTKKQRRAMALLARGGVRYGTMHAQMSRLRDLGLAYAHNTGVPGLGQWTWRLTPDGWATAKGLGLRATDKRAN